MLCKIKFMYTYYIYVLILFFFHSTLYISIILLKVVNKRLLKKFIINLFQLSIVRNQLLRMYGVSKLHNLVTLNLANNGILTIEGIKDMINLQTLCLAGNNIKV